MNYRPNLTAKSVLNGITAVVVSKAERKVNPKYHNSEDVSNYPKEASFVIIADKFGNNLGRNFKIKLRNTDNLALQQTIDFDKADVSNGRATFWADQNRYVQVSLKGDEIIERK